MTSFHADAVAHDLRGEGAHVFAGGAGDAHFFAMADPALAREDELDLYLAQHYLPLRRAGTTMVIACTESRDRAWLDAKFSHHCCVEVAPNVLAAELVHRFARRMTDDAIFGLARCNPSLSAHRVVTRGQVVGGVLAGCILLAALARAPLPVLVALVIAFSALFVVSVLFRIVLAWLGAAPRAVPDHQVALRDDELPVYTVLVPLYREARVLPALAKAMQALDYPADRLDIKLIVEADDLETVAVAHAVARTGPFAVVAVPPSLPRTKPKATNFALRLARGEFVVIYDAEDRPETDQLRKAVAEFRRLPARTACLQARLAFFNARENWLTRLFAIDYDVWFGVLLPGLDRLGVPMPLGGTSNHFRTSVLREIHGWDPFNVTEDADLGLRLAQLGHRVAMLDSTTYEEAPTQVGAWIKQRSRWLKGYMQTWLVHGRNLPEVVRHVGLGGVLAFQLFIGGAVLSALINPLLWAVFAASMVMPLPIFSGFSGHMVQYGSGAGAVGANALLTYLAVMGSKWRREPGIGAYGLTVTLYWGLISIAGYRGLWHLLTKPFHWEKTAHGLSKQGAADA